MAKLTPDEFTDSLKSISDRETSANPEGWTPENPLWGHCAVVALLGQDQYGGELVRGTLSDHPKYSHLRSHYWNKLPDGTEVDFTHEQYSDLTFQELAGEVRSRELVLKHPDTTRRYQLLKDRMGV
jgi:hypothetical protein